MEGIILHMTLVRILSINQSIIHAMSFPFHGNQAVKGLIKRILVDIVE